MTILVDIALATLCILGPGDSIDSPPPESCHPVLIGGDTPRGEFKLQQRYVTAKGYGGDVLQFKEEELELYAIHRVWTLRPWEKRAQRLKMKNPKMRQVTKGCINVEPALYEKLVGCCSTDTLIIR